MPSFMRRGSDRINHRRYKLSVDSWYLKVPVICSGRHEDDVLANDAIIQVTYYLGYTSATYGRPLSPRLEVERQITYWISHFPSTSILHHLHILATIQAISYLSKHGCDVYPGTRNPFSDDLPLIQFQKSTLRKFNGQSVAHFVFQQLYRTLSNVNPYGKYNTHEVYLTAFFRLR